MSGKRLTHLFFLDGLIDKERGPERRLLRHLDIHCQEMGGLTNETKTDLFRFDGMGELWRERDVRDGDIIQNEVES